MAIHRKPFKERFLKQRTIGSWITIGKSEIAEVMTECGFDWLVIDMEHTAITLDLAQDLVRTIELAGSTPLIRVGENNTLILKRAMDTGAHGVIVPMVNTPEEAQAAVAAVRYPPEGKRGVGLGRAQRYGIGFDEYRQWLQRESVVIVQIEHIRAVENLEAILQTPGVDGFLVGPYDLSGSLGVPGIFDHPKMLAALEKIQDQIRASKIPAGFHSVSPDPAAATEKLEQGYQFVAYSMDAWMLSNAYKQGLAVIQKALTAREKIGI